MSPWNLWYPPRISFFRRERVPTWFLKRAVFFLFFFFCDLTAAMWRRDKARECIIPKENDPRWHVLHRPKQSEERRTAEEHMHSASNKYRRLINYGWYCYSQKWGCTSSETGQKRACFMLLCSSIVSAPPSSVIPLLTLSLSSSPLSSPLPSLFLPVSPASLSFALFFFFPPLISQSVPLAR